MISTNDMRAGQSIVHDGRICAIAEYQRVKPGKGPTFVKVKLKDLVTGQMLDHTWRGEQKVELATLRTRKHQYLYRQGSDYHFMDLETYDQINFSEDRLEGVVEYLKDGMEVDITFYKNAPIKIAAPDFVELAVAETDPGARGDTVTGGTKPAKLESGAIIQVPLFIEVGQVLKVDTRTGTYVSRA